MTKIPGGNRPERHLEFRGAVSKVLFPTAPACTAHALANNRRPIAELQSVYRSAGILCARRPRARHPQRSLECIPCFRVWAGRRPVGVSID